MKDFTWIYLPDSEISKVSAQEHAGETAHFAISLWDTPTALGVKLDKAGKYLVLKFEYISESENKELIKGKFARILIGKNSKRLYEFECDLESLDKEFEEVVPNKGRLQSARELRALKVALRTLRDQVERIQELKNRDININNLNALDNVTTWWERQPKKTEVFNHI